MSEARQERSDAIDALRAIAILFVLSYHYTARFPPEYMRFDQTVPWPWHGVYGVYLFFIVSGYCIMMTAERSGSRSQFLLRRFTRLQPALVVSIVVTVSVVGFFGLPSREVSALTAFQNALWVPLFSPNSSLVDGAYWSILVEVKFYVVFAALYFIKPNSGLWLFVAFVSVGALMHFTGIGMSHKTAIYPFRGISVSYFIFPFSLFFLIGVAARSANYATQIAIVSTCVVTMYFLWGWSSSFAWGAAVSAVGAIGVQCRGIRLWRPIVYVGLISYPLYLLHQNVGVAVIREMNAWGITPPYIRIAIATLAVIFLAAVVSWAVEHRFRQPIERGINTISERFLRILQVPSHPLTSSARKNNRLPIRSEDDECAVPPTAQQMPSRSSNADAAQ
ncbi:acyltransferase [Aminobacter sp. MSH1]|uniref:acyltransferase family protein n=1 Tax=Aminobacter sp. MSH1 TaxID=374606 RepID=UPI000D3A8BB4|nr:acyltransferase [Aminobacter sp. MSH1]